MQYWMWSAIIVLFTSEMIKMGIAMFNGERDLPNAATLSDAELSDIISALVEAGDLRCEDYLAELSRRGGDEYSCAIALIRSHLYAFTNKAQALVFAEEAASFFPESDCPQELEAARYSAFKRYADLLFINGRYVDAEWFYHKCRASIDDGLAEPDDYIALGEALSCRRNCLMRGGRLTMAPWTFLYTYVNRHSDHVELVDALMKECDDGVPPDASPVEKMFVEEVWG